MHTFAKTRARRIATRMAVAGALVAIPLSAVAVPAFADTGNTVPSATTVDWNNHNDQWNNRDRDRDHRRDHDRPGPAQPPAPQNFLPPTGSA